ncbi:MAG: sugar ABC transporter permease [Actinomycetaceae bacterium]|nr:sugar ABC transporter permease [Actinomycetaceae bacterium]
MTTIRQLFGGDMRQYGMIGALIAILLFFQWKTGGLVFTPTNFINLVQGNTYVLILALGMLLVIVAGHIDLSVGSVAAFVGIIVAMAYSQWGWPEWAAILLGLCLGAIVGAWQGFWVAFVGVPAFVVTLSGWMLFRGLNQWVGASLTVPSGPIMQYLGGGFLPDIMPDVIPFNLPTMILAAIGVLAVAWRELSKRAKARKYDLETVPVWVSIARVVVLSAVILSVMWIFASGNVGTSIPVSGLIVIVLVLFYSFLSTKTILGRGVYAVGGNRQAAALAGVSLRKTNFFVMFNNALLASVAAVVFIGRAHASGPQDGNLWELDAIAAVFIGGAAVTGGVGTVMGTMVGALVMASLNNGLSLMGIGIDRTQVIKGAVLLAAVALDVYSKQQGKRSVIGMFQNAWRRNRGEPGTSPALVTSAEDASLANSATETPTSTVPVQDVARPGTSDPLGRKQ